MSEETKDLDQALIDMIAEHQRLTLMLNGALNYFCRQNGLTGRWDIHPNGKQIYKVQE